MFYTLITFVQFLIAVNESRNIIVISFNFKIAVSCMYCLRQVSVDFIMVFMFKITILVNYLYLSSGSDYTNLKPVRNLIRIKTCCRKVLFYL